MTAPTAIPHHQRPFQPVRAGAALMVALAAVVGSVAGPAPSPAVAATAIPGKWYGFNLAGAEWNETKLPGTINKDYVYSADPNRQAYFAGKGMKLVRVPFRWERLQPQANKPLSSADVAGLKSMIAAANAQGQQVILVAQNFGMYYRKALNKNDGRKFADFWNRMASTFRNQAGLFGYELMNEPHDLPGGSATWATLAQAATTGIRKADTVSWVLVPGYQWQTATFWRDNNENLNVQDPNGKLLYAAHLYFDNNFSGRYTTPYNSDGAYPSIGVDRVKPFTDWLTAKGFRGIMTEYGTPNTDGDPDGGNQWDTVLANFLNAVHAHPNLVGGAAWAAGPLWAPSFPAGYNLSIEPTWSGTTAIDKPQMAVLDDYPSGAW